MPHGKVTIDLTDHKFWSYLREHRVTKISTIARTQSAPTRFIKLIADGIAYAFPDVAAEFREEVIRNIIALANGLEDLAAIIYNWHVKLPAEAIIGFSLSDPENLARKAKLSTEFLCSELHTHRNKRVAFVDVGTGGKALTWKMAEILRQDKIHTEVFTVDLHEPGEYWSYEKANAHGQALSREYRYDGKDIAGVLNAINCDKTVRDSITVISLQHAFHHWVNSQAQEAWLEKLSAVCADGTMLLLKEHWNLMHDDQLALNHLLVNFRYNMICSATKETQYKINSVTDAKKIVQAYIAGSGEFNFMSPFWLKAVMNKYGFELVDVKEPQVNDVDKNAIFVFKKQHNVLSIQAIDDLEAEMQMKKFAPKRGCVNKFM